MKYLKKSFSRIDFRNLAVPILVLSLGLLLPQIGVCSVEGSLGAIQGRLIGTILPLAAILGLVFAGLSFVAGSPNARQHLILAMIGAAVGFGAPSIVNLIKELVN